MKAMTRTKTVTWMRPRSPRPVTNRKDPVETRRDGRTDAIFGVQIEGRTFHREHSDGSPRTGDDDDHEAREPHSPGRQSSTETRTKGTRRKSRKLHSSAMRNNSQRKLQPVPKHPTANICSTEAAIENKAAEVESISSESKRSSVRSLVLLPFALPTSDNASPLVVRFFV